MRRHKWGIWWLLLLAWNAANLGTNLTRGRYWWALAAATTAVWCAVLAYRRLTERRVTVTIRTVNGHRVINFGDDVVIRNETPKP